MQTALLTLYTVTKYFDTVF